MKNLKNKIKIIPGKPGIYIFKDDKGQTIYIGKALSLKDRIKSYFCRPPSDPKTKILVQQINDFDYQIVPSEFEALLLEAKLIKEYKPKYNSQLKDDKRYLYIGITKSPFRVFPLRRPELEKNLLDWLGPFPSAGSVRQVLKIIRRIFPFCSCRRRSKRQCLYFHMNLCPGLENLLSEKYRKDIIQIRKVLSGKTKLLTRSLEKKMNQAAKRLNYEEAQKFKNQLSALQYVTSGWKTIPEDDLGTSKSLAKLRRLLVKYQRIDPVTLNKIEGYDVSNLGKTIIVSSMVTFIGGQPDKGLYRKFKIKKSFALLGKDHRRGGRRARQKSLFEPYSNRIEKAKSKIRREWTPRRWREKNKPAHQNDPASIHQVISRRLNHPEWLYPQLILVDGGQAQIQAAFVALKEKNLSMQICLLGLTKREETLVVPKIVNNKIASWESLSYSRRSLVLKLLQQIRDESHRFAQKYYQHLHLKKIII